MADIFNQTVCLRVVEGAGNGEQGHVLFGVVLDEEVDDIALSIDHVCGSRSVSLGPLTDSEKKHIRPKGFSEGKEPVTLSSTSGSGSITVSSATA